MVDQSCTGFGIIYIYTPPSTPIPCFRPTWTQVLNEEIKDLLAGGSGSDAGAAAAGGLPIRENLQGEVSIAGLSQHQVNDAIMHGYKKHICVRATY